MSKPNIKTFGTTYNYLNDPALRTKETNDSLLTIKGALFSGVNFQYLTWRNIHFVDCDFAGGYEIKLEAMANCVFEGCKIVGIHDFGEMNSVRFYKYLSGSNSNWGGNVGSKNVMFEECQFIGDTPDRNHQGAIGTYGEASFLNCKMKWFGITGDTGVTIKGCELEDVNCSPNASKGDGAPVLIENSKLRGTFDMVPASLQSLTIRDTVIDNLDLSGATIKGDTLMERVVADRMNLAVTSGGAISLRSVKVNGSGQKVFYLAANRFSSVLLDDCTVSANLEGERAWIGGAPTEPAYAAQPPWSQSVTFRNSTLPRLDASYLNTARLLIENTAFNHLVMSHARVGSMVFIGAQFSVALDLSNAQVKQFKHSGGTPLKKLAGLKLDGSNVKLN